MEMMSRRFVGILESSVKRIPILILKEKSFYNPIQILQVIKKMVFRSETSYDCRLDAKPALQLHFKVPSSTVSGLSVETLMITNEKYKPYKGVRTMTKSGKFQIRT